MGCNCSKTDASAEVVPKADEAVVVPPAAVEAPVQNVAMHSEPILEKPVPKAIKNAEAEQCDDWKDAHSVSSNDKMSASKKKRMKQRKLKAAASPETVPSTVHESKVAEALVNQSADQAYFSADSEVPKKPAKDAGQIRRKNKPATRT